MQLVTALRLPEARQRIGLSREGSGRKALEKRDQKVAVMPKAPKAGDDVDGAGGGPHHDHVGGDTGQCDLATGDELRCGA